MTKTFKEKWLESVERKNSVLCAGLDPADFKMRRGDKGLPEEANKLKWAVDYVRTVAPYVTAIKPNFQYWKGIGDLERLRTINNVAKELDLIVIDDSKLADIGSTNEAGVFYSKDMMADAVTIAPYAGNMEETKKYCNKHGIGAITMCLMSNPEYQREKNMLVRLNENEKNEYQFEDIMVSEFSEEIFTKRYLSLAHDANKFGLDGIVVGATSKDNHIEEYEIERVREYFGNNGIVLLPGVGAQGGEAKLIWKHFDKNNVIVNVGRSLMFPKGSNSTPDDQAKTAIEYRDMLNQSRIKQ